MVHAPALPVLFLLLPIRPEPYTVSRIMCLGARSATHHRRDVDHQSIIPIAHLRTSFAYRLFRTMCFARPLRLTARTGKTSHESVPGANLVEHEDIIEEGHMESEWLQLCNKFFHDSNAEAQGIYEVFMKMYVDKTIHRKTQLQTAYNDHVREISELWGESDQMKKYGRLV
jgi:hypothetical protein